MHWVAYLWPGLPHLWLRGSIAGLALAIAFTVLLNVTAVATMVYPEWLAPRLKLACGGATLLVWIVALLETRAELRRVGARREAEAAGMTPEEDALAQRRTEQADERFIGAQQNYLRGDWLGTERALLELLRHEPEDVEGRLLLATLWRRQNRRREAEGQLRRLARMEAARVWSTEIEFERSRLSPTLIESLSSQQKPRQNPSETPNDEQKLPAA